MKRSIFLTTTILLVTAGVGCKKSTEPTNEAPKVVQSDPQWTSVALHIEGFKKSKSGAT